MPVLLIADEGKFLVDEETEQIRIVTEVDTDARVAYVEPDPDIAKAVLQDLGFDDAGGDDIEVPAESVETVTDSEFRVAKDP